MAPGRPHGSGPLMSEEGSLHSLCQLSRGEKEGGEGAAFSMVGTGYKTLTEGKVVFPC